MGKKKTPRPRFRTRFRALSQLLFLAIFIGALALGKPQIWLLVFLVLGIGGTLLAGRVYCGWICPMGSVMAAQSWIWRKLKIRRLPGEQLFRRFPALGWSLRWFLLAVFLAVMVLSRRFGWDFPLLLYLLGAAVLLSAVFEESLWHRRLCPFGTLLTLPSRISRRRIQIDPAACTGCGLCQGGCPSGSITVLPPAEGQGAAGPAVPAAQAAQTVPAAPGAPARTNQSEECLVCGRCMEVCPAGAIHYG